MMYSRLAVAVWTLLALASFLFAETPTLVVRPEKPAAVYTPGEKIVWRVEVLNDPGHMVPQATYEVKKSGAAIVKKGELNFAEGSATIETSVGDPCTLLASVKAAVPDAKPLEALGGAAIAPENIPPSLPIPDDFDAFWKAKIEELEKIPVNAVLEKADADRPNVDYWKITMDNIRGTHIQGQLARPAGDSKCPAMLVLQWAGVYPLQKAWITGHAAEGWLVLNIEAHDIPIDQPQSYYDELNKGALKGYTAIGNDDREQSYFLRMLLSCYRSAEFLAARPDWDGKTLLVTGSSQGGLQSIAAAALNPKITALMVSIPAGCDNSAQKAGRKYGWPYWMSASAQGKDEAKMLETSRYFDGVNFASRVSCPALVGLGLLDTTSPATGVFAAINSMKGTKDVVVMPLARHKEEGDSHAAYHKRSTEWRKALLKAGAPPAPNF